MTTPRARYVVAMPTGRDLWTDWRRYRQRPLAIQRAADLAKVTGEARVWYEYDGERALIARARA